MRFFQRSILLSRPNGDKTDYIPPCGSFTFEFDVPERDFPVTHSFRLAGEPDYFWKWRCEAGSPYSISMAIDDALCTRETFREKYSLKFDCHNEPYERNAWIKLFRQDISPGKKHRFVIAGKAENLAFVPGGEVAAELEIYYAKPGRHPNDVFDAPDEVKRLTLPQGSYDWQEISQEFTMQEEAVCIIVHIGIKGASGLFYLGSPRLCPEGEDSIIPGFDHQQHREKTFCYVAENISRRDWLEVDCKIDGKTVYSGENYTSIFRRPDYEIELGSLTPGRHTMTLELRNDYETAVGFVVQQLELLEYGSHSFELVAAPEYVPENQFCHALICTNSPSVAIFANGEKFTFDRTGLHGLKLPLSEGRETRYELKSDDFCDTFTVKHAPVGGDKIYLSTGDAIFIHQTPRNMERFIEWYLANNLGNAVCFRHSYRWGGGRFMNPAVWEKMTSLLEEMNIHYSLMVDGRELPGMHTNPPDSLLESALYLGRQAHENDGSFCYWGNELWKDEPLPEPYADILSRSVNPGGIQPHVRPKRNGDRAWWFFDPTNASDMKEASEDFVKNLAEAKGDSTRHSGPSALFRYFFQAGYKFLLAEQMYGPEEVILAALRGASRAYGAEGFGAHLAAQWSSTPHDTPEHAERYFLSLAACYMQGVTQINLEEGLYRMEKGFVDFDRYSQNCLMHQEAHTKFRRFMETHPRKGKLVTPIACVQGRYDGWSCFSRDNVWRREGEEWAFGDAEKSFDLLNVFYPRSKFSDIYCCPCPVEPQGWYTGTPYGPVDLIPFEGDWSAYRVIIFLGWHTFKPEDGRKMLEFVRNGGTLLLTRRHLSRTLKHNSAPEISENEAIAELLGSQWLTQETGVIRRNVGSGEVICFMAPEYPANGEICCAYSDEMRKLGEKICQEEAIKGWVRGNDDVNFAVYETDDCKRTAYLLNIRWWDRADSEATLVNRNSVSRLPVPEGEILQMDFN